MSEVRLIALCGDIGAGKSTVARILQGHGYARTRFAHYIKATMRAWGLSDDEVDGHLKETPCELLCGATPRNAQRIVGTECGRGVHPDLWVHLWATNLANPVLARGGAVVVDDCRFANEAERVRAMGGFIVRVNRPGTGAEMTSHASDTYRVSEDICLINDGPLDVLEHRVQGILDLLLRDAVEDTA